MRNFAQVLPQFWTGDTGLAISKLGDKTQLLALYLITGPESTMTGLYHILPSTLLVRLRYPLDTLETPFEGPSEGLRRLHEIGFCQYDWDRNIVWVIEMAHFQIGGPLKAYDNLIVRIKKDIEPFRNSPLFNAFCERYGTDFHLEIPPPFKGVHTPFPTPSPTPSGGGLARGTGTGTGTGTGKNTSAPGPTESHLEEEAEEVFFNSKEQIKIEKKPESPTVLAFPCNGNVKSWNLTENKIAEYRESFPSLDILSEAKKSLQWIRDNPDRKKTARGMPRFLGSWLGRANDRSNGSKVQQPSRATVIPLPPGDAAFIRGKIDWNDWSEKTLAKEHIALNERLKRK